MFSVILKRWMKSYAIRNASPIIPSYTHPILHILAYVAILRDPTTAQNESNRWTGVYARAQGWLCSVCVCVCVCVCVHMLEYSASMTAAVLRNTKILPVYEKFVY
jgi:cobalamin biosynthesis protein CobD/CbiB